MERKKTIQDIVIMTILMVVSLLFYFIFIPAQIRLSAAWSGNIAFSSRTFPKLLMGSIFIVSGISLINAIIRYVKLRKADDSQREFHAVSDKKVMKTFFKVCLVYLIMLFYAILFTEFGYIASTLFIPPVLLFVLGCRKWQYYIYVYAFAAIIYILFIYVLKVPMQ